MIISMVRDAVVWVNWWWWSCLLFVICCLLSVLRWSLMVGCGCLCCRCGCCRGGKSGERFIWQVKDSILDCLFQPRVRIPSQAGFSALPLLGRWHWRWDGHIADFQGALLESKKGWLIFDQRCQKCKVSTAICLGYVWDMLKGDGFGTLAWHFQKHEPIPSNFSAGHSGTFWSSIVFQRFGATTLCWWGQGGISRPCLGGFLSFFAYRLTFLRAWQNPDPFQIPRRLTWNRDRNHTTEVSWRRSLWFHLQRCQTRWWSHTMQLRLSLSFWQRIHHPSWWKEAPKFNLMFSGDMTTVCRSWKVVLLRTNGKTEKGSDCSTILPLSSLNRPWRDDMRCELLA